MEDIMKIVQSPKDSVVLKKDANGTTENETKVQRSGFQDMLLGTLGASLLKNMLASKGIIAARSGIGISVS